MRSSASRSIARYRLGVGQVLISVHGLDQLESPCKLTFGSVQPFRSAKHTRRDTGW